MSYIYACGDYFRIPLESVCRMRVQLRDTDLGGHILLYHTRLRGEYVPELRYIHPRELAVGEPCRLRGTPVRAVKLCIHYTTRYCVRSSRSSNIVLDVRLCTVVTNRMLRRRWEQVRDDYMSRYRDLTAAIRAFHREEVLRIRRSLWRRLELWMLRNFGNSCIGWDAVVVAPGTVERMSPATVYIGWSQTVAPDVPIDTVYGVMCRCLRGEVDKCREIYETVTRVEVSPRRFARWLRR